MEIAKIKVSGVRADKLCCKDIPHGIIGAQVEFEFDSTWQNLRKTVVFRGCCTKDVLDAGDIVTIPAEVVANPGVRLSVGVYGTNADGTLVIPTIWAELGVVRYAADPSGDASTDPSLPVWAQIQAAIGKLEDLGTADKSSLVAAINEAAKTGGNSSQNVTIDTTLTQSGQAADAAATGARLTALEQLGGITVIEPMEDDIPKVYFTGTLPTSKDEEDLRLTMRYVSKTADFGYPVTLKVQGSSSANYPKKNFTLKPYKDSTYEKKQKLAFKNWHEMNKFVLKAHWIDHSHVRNVGTAKIWGKIVRSRSDYDSLPEELRNAPNNGATDGFTVKVFANGVYQGLYEWIVPKDKLFGQDSDIASHSILNSEWNNQPTCAFATTAPSINGNWSEELLDEMTADTKTSMTNWIKFVAGATDADFVANAENYFDVQSVIDADIFDRVFCTVDNLCRNQIVFKYDAKWFVGKWDLDAVLGLPPMPGQNFFAYNTAYQTGYVAHKDYGITNLLYQRVETLFIDRFKARYAELRSGVLSVDNIIDVYERLTDTIKTYDGLLEEDFASTTGGGKFTDIPYTAENNIQQIRNFIAQRIPYMDEVIASMTVVEPVPCTGITLDVESLTFTEEGTQTLTASVTPSGCTDSVTWETTDDSIASVSNGVVTAKMNGTVTITAKCGNYSATCIVNINGIDGGDVSEPDETLVYSLAEPITFDGVDDYLDTGVQMFIPPHDFTAFVEFQTDPDCAKGGNIWYCMHDASPYAGLNLYYNGSTHLLSGQSTATPAHARNKFLMTYSHTDNVVRYTANGVIPETGNWLNRPEATSDGVTVTENLSLGSGQQPSGNRNAFWKGTIFQCKVWDGILTAEQIASLFA